MKWVGPAVLLHAALVLLLVSWDKEAVVMLPVPIQVSLLDPVQETPAPPKPKAPEPVKPAPRKPQPAAKPKPAEQPVPVSTVPVANPVPVAAAPAQPTAETSAPASSAPATATAPASGGPLVEARFDAAYLQNPQPAYPALSRRMGEEGRVLLRAYVLPSGMPESVELKQSSGSSRLDEAALVAVRKWRFVPARRGSEAVAAWVVIPISFRLES